MKTDQAIEYQTSMASTDLDYPQQLIDYRNGFMLSKIMFTACELGIFDLLHDVGEPLSTAAIAAHLHTNIYGTDLLLTACVGLKLLKAEVKNMEVYYSNTDVSSVYLVKSSPKSLYHMMMFYSNTTYPTFQFLPQAVREGEKQLGRSLGISSKDGYLPLYRSEEDLVNFMHFMDNIANLYGTDAIQAFDLSEFHTVYDIGGCSGAYARQFISIYPGSTVTIMDLPRVVEAAKKYFIKDNDPKILFHEGDFFTDVIPEADLYILVKVIHNWGDEKCLQLLKKIYQSCRPGGAVLIIEVVLNEDRSGPVHGQLCSLHMLLLFSEGKERMASEFHKLLTDSGFKDIQVRSTGKIYNAILARK